MRVCAHGDVAEFCKDRDMVISEKYRGDLNEYGGCCPVVVTDQDMSENEYYALKGKLLGRGVELISTRHKDDPKVVSLLTYQAESRKQKYGGRQPFGFYRKNGRVVQRPNSIVVVKRILELRDTGATLQRISEDPEVHHPDGRKISISTIQQIIKNRDRYEK